jgi:hypothetical protein
MKQILASILVVVLTVAMALAAMFVLVYATQQVAAIQSLSGWVVGVCVELLLGVVLLLSTVWVATHFAVRIFGHRASTDSGGPLA